MVHLKPLPGSPGYGGSMDEVMEAALRDAGALDLGGADGMIIENYGDMPFHAGRVGPETVAAMTCIAREIRKSVNRPLGINVLRNDAGSALAIASVIGCAFIRVNVHAGVTATDQGLISGRADETLRLRSQWKSNVKIWADVDVKHGSPLCGLSIGDRAEDLAHRAFADAVIVTGKATGRPVSVGHLAEVKARLPGTPVIAGSGVTADNLREILAHADGVIAGTSLKKHSVTGSPVDEGSVRRLVELRDQITERRDL
jgi:membrane complex biogenesis BtpA family protein